MSVSRDSADQVVRVGDRLDGTTAAEVRRELHGALVDGTGDLVADFSDVEVIDAIGLGLVMDVHRRATRSGRRLVLRDVPPRVLRLLAVTRLHRILPVEFTSVTAAA